MSELFDQGAFSMLSNQKVGIIGIFINILDLDNEFACSLSTHADRQFGYIGYCLCVCFFVCLYGYGLLRRG